MEIFYVFLGIGMILLITSVILNIFKFRKPSGILLYVASFILCIDAVAILIMMAIDVVAYYLIKK